MPFVGTEQQGNIMEHQVVMDVRDFSGEASERTMYILVDLVGTVLSIKIREISVDTVD